MSRQCTKCGLTPEDAQGGACEVAVEHEWATVAPAPSASEAVDHPGHYGGKDNPYEVIKVIRAWGLGFSLGNVVKYIYRADKKGALLQDLRKALWYLAEEIETREKAEAEVTKKR